MQGLALWTAALMLFLTMPLESRRMRLVLLVIVAGAMRMAVARLPAPPVATPADGDATMGVLGDVAVDTVGNAVADASVDASVDDRDAERIRGIVSGPVEDAPDRRQFVIAAGDTRILVTARAPLPPVLPGDTVVVEGWLRTPRGYRNPGAVDMRRVVAARGASLTMSARQVEITAAGWSPWRWPTAVQRRASAFVAGRGAAPVGPEDANAVVRAMVLGDRAGLGPALTERFRDAGVSHVLAVSGLHLAVVALLVFAAVRRSWAALSALAPGLTRSLSPELVAALAAAPVAIAFTMITGGRISTLRALLVVLLVLAGAATARRARVVDALGAAALVLLLVQPASLFDPSFQLSFAATATLALALGGSPARAAETLPGRAGRALWGLLCASLWATLATAPFAALAFGRVALGGIAANLIVVPLTELVIVPVGLLGVVTAGVWTAAGGALVDLAVVAAGVVVWVADQVARVAPVLDVPPPGAWELAGCALLWTAAVCAVRRAWPARTCAIVAGAGAGVLATVWIASAWVRPALQDELRVTFLDVGQGDAAVVELPGGGVWMIDSGGLPFVIGARDMDEAERRRLAGLPGERAVARFLAERRIDRIDVMVLSHPHPDHYEGLRAVARKVEIGALWLARPHDRARTAPSYRDLLTELSDRGTRIVYPQLGRPLVQGGARMTALAPRYLDGTAAADPISSINDNSLVVLVAFAGRSVLFTGDIEEEGEALLVERYGAALRADVVKVPHHGSRTSSTADLVAATAPAWAVISCGVANRFDFPGAGVVARWQDAGARVLRTDRVGAVTVVIRPDGAMRVESFDTW